MRSPQCTGSVSTFAILDAWFSIPGQLDEDSAVRTSSAPSRDLAQRIRELLFRLGIQRELADAWAASGVVVGDARQQHPPDQGGSASQRLDQIAEIRTVARPCTHRRRFPRGSPPSSGRSWFLHDRPRAGLSAEMGRDGRDPSHQLQPPQEPRVGELESLSATSDLDALCLQECDTSALPEEIGPLHLADSTKRNRLGLAVYYRRDRYDAIETRAYALETPLHDMLFPRPRTSASSERIWPTAIQGTTWCSPRSMPRRSAR